MKKKKSQHGGQRTGAGRPSLSPERRRVRLTVRIDPETDQKIWNYCEQHNTSAGVLIDELILGKFVVPPPKFEK